jgi:hypothetical protein
MFKSDPGFLFRIWEEQVPALSNVLIDLSGKDWAKRAMPMWVGLEIQRLLPRQNRLAIPFEGAAIDARSLLLGARQESPLYGDSWPSTATR